MTRLERMRKGSNQYKTRYRNHGYYYLAGYLTFVIVLGIGCLALKKETIEKAWAEEPIIKAYIENVTPTPTPELGDETEAIREEIRNTFGEHADKAFKVLSCENASLNPKAVNTAGNSPEGSRDMGIFQINEYWQGVHAKFLLNWKTNIRLAYQIFEENGYSFERWTCGRKFGI
jgi:hypothetical protein